MRKLRLGMLVGWAVIFSFVGCNTIWGIDEGHLALDRDGASAGEAGARNEATGGDAGHAEPGGEAGTLGGAGATGGAGEDSGGAAGDASVGGASMGGMSMGTGGAPMSTGGATSGAGGSTPTCACKAGEVQTTKQTCGRCGTGSQSRTRTCGASCNWGAWSAWGTCSQCDTQNWRCCGAGKWEWCYDSDCAWTQNCAACAASSCDC